MRKHIYKFRRLLMVVFLTVSLYGCKNELRNPANTEVSDNDRSYSSKKIKSSDERKVPTGTVNVQFDGESASFTDFDPNMTTDVTFLDNGIQFVITSMKKEAVLVNMYAPEFFKKIPITISQQSYAIPVGESFEVKTQSRLEVTIPNNPVHKRDTKVLYEGTVTLSELSENRLVLTFSGTGLPIADSKTDFFPLSGKIVLENFNVYDFRE